MDLSGESGQPGSSPLERYSLNQLRVTAVVIDERLGSTAVIEDSSGRGYSVKLGSRVGERNGTVVGIVADRVTVLQRTVDFSGREHSERVELKLLPPTKRDRKR
jgi:type IV pilus assembly protein PilP